jgi:hypothetical protein
MEKTQVAFLRMYFWYLLGSCFAHRSLNSHTCAAPARSARLREITVEMKTTFSSWPCVGGWRMGNQLENTQKFMIEGREMKSMIQMLMTSENGARKSAPPKIRPAIIH